MRVVLMRRIGSGESGDFPCIWLLAKMRDKIVFVEIRRLVYVLGDALVRRNTFFSLMFQTGTENVVLKHPSLKCNPHQFVLCVFFFCLICA